MAQGRIYSFFLKSKVSFYFMGIIKRQGIKQSIVTYVGITIGMLNMLWIYPSFISTQELGLIKFLQSTALFIVPFVFLGSSNLIVRFFPEFKDKENKHHGFLFFITMLLGIGIVFFLLLFYFLNDFISEYYENRSEYYVVQYLPHLVILTLLVAFSHLFTTYILNFKRIVVPSLFNDLFVKISIPILVLLYYFEYLDLTGLVNGILVAYGLIVLAMMIYLKWLGEFSFQPNFKLLTKSRLQRMSVYMGFGILGSLGSKLANQIDIIMVTSLADLSFAGIYALALTISTVIDVPRRALTKIISPILAEVIKNDDRAELKMLYQKSALTQFIAGLYIFLGIWVCIDHLFAIMPQSDQFMLGKYVVLFLGMSKLVDMLSGINGEIIVYSKYFRYQSYFILCLAVFNVAANLLWIPIFQINGAALATLSSLSLYNILKFILVKKKYNIQPFTKPMIWVFLIGLFTYICIELIPNVPNHFLNIVINAILVTIIYGGLIIYFKPSPDINHLVEQGWEKAKNYLS